MQVRKVTKRDGAADDSRSLSDLLRWYPDGTYYVIVESAQEYLRKQRRTNSQNALLWSYLTDLSTVLNRETGQERWTSQELYDYLCWTMSAERVTPDGKVYRQRVSTSSLSKEAMSAFLERVQAHMSSEFGIRVPLPGDDDYELFRRDIDGDPQ